jgi:hypothetical protein
VDKQQIWNMELRNRNMDQNRFLLKKKKQEKSVYFDLIFYCIPLVVFSVVEAILQFKINCSFVTERLNLKVDGDGKRKSFL